MRRRRLDHDLVRRGLAGSADDAARLVSAGRVTVGGAPASTPGRFVRPDEVVRVLAPSPRFVTRAGAKLDAAIGQFAIPVSGARALDVGASGGGFTDCLLQHDASQVVAVDVGYGQLHERFRTDPRVVVRDRTNIRDLQPGDLGAPFDLIVADVSFISLRLLAPHLLGHARPGTQVVALVKPQFEATRDEATRAHGVIEDTGIHERVLAEVAESFARNGAAVLDTMASPVRGTSGNVEYLMHAEVTAPPPAFASPGKGT